MKAAMLNVLRLAGLDLAPVLPRPPDPRGELKRRRQATVEARERHERELEVVARLQSLGPIADQLEAEAQAAEAVAGGSVASWARGESGEAVGDGELFRKAEIARSRAIRARIAANGAADTLVAQVWDTNSNRMVDERSTPAEVEARRALRAAESDEQLARGPILAATIEPALAEFEALMERVRELDSELQGLECFGTYGSGGAGLLSILNRYRSARRLDAIPTHQETRARLRLPWLRFDNKLKQDPDAQF